MTKDGFMFSDSQKDFSTIQIEHDDGSKERHYCFVLSKMKALKADADLLPGISNKMHGTKAGLFAIPL